MVYMVCCVAYDVIKSTGGGGDGGNCNVGGDGGGSGDSYTDGSGGGGGVVYRAQACRCLKPCCFFHFFRF